MNNIIIYVTTLCCLLNCKTRSKYEEELDRLAIVNPKEARFLYMNPPIVKELQRIYPDEVITQDLRCKTELPTTEKCPNWILNRTNKNVKYWGKFYNCSLPGLQWTYMFKLEFYKPIPEEMVAGYGDVTNMSSDFVHNIKIQKYCAIDFYNFRTFGSSIGSDFPWKDKENLAKSNRFHLHLKDMYFESGSDLCNKEENPDLP